MLTKIDGYMLVFTTDKVGRYVHATRQYGNLYFGERVHQRAITFAIDCVDRLGLKDTRIFFGRGGGKHPRGIMRGKATIPSDGRTVGVFYAWRIRAGDTDLMRHEASGAIKEISVIESVILHELLHIRYPEGDEDWVFDKTYEILFDGWQALQ